MGCNRALVASGTNNVRLGAQHVHVLQPVGRQQHSKPTAAASADHDWPPLIHTRCQQPLAHGVQVAKLQSGRGHNTGQA